MMQKQFWQPELVVRCSVSRDNKESTCNLIRFSTLQELPFVLPPLLLLSELLLLLLLLLILLLLAALTEPLLPVLHP